MLGLLIICALTLTGCGSDEVDFVINTEGVAPPDDEFWAAKEAEFRASGREGQELITRLEEEKQVHASAEKNIPYSLAALFGTPDDPFVADKIATTAGIQLSYLRMAAGPTGGKDMATRDLDTNEVVEEFRVGGLYREHCAHCHGVTGDGAGPSARFLDPYPRDYRNGVFKFTSTESQQKPTDEDLMRTLRDGLHGSYMPAFGVMLKPDELTALTQYVKYLAIRGETEIALREVLIVEGSTFSPGLLDLELDGVLAGWNQETLAAKVIQPPPYPVDLSDELALQASIDRGRELFEGAGTCVKCHGPTGLGDGQEMYDLWNEDKALEEDLDVRATRWTLPLQQLRARNLQLGIYRAGRRPIDIYWRIASGVNGAQMPAANTGGAAIPDPDTGEDIPPMSREDIWHIVNYVLYGLPYERTGRQRSVEIAGPNRG